MSEQNNHSPCRLIGLPLTESHHDMMTTANISAAPDQVRAAMGRWMRSVPSRCLPPRAHDPEFPACLPDPRNYPRNRTETRIDTGVFQGLAPCSPSDCLCWTLDHHGTARQVLTGTPPIRNFKKTLPLLLVPIHIPLPHHFQTQKNNFTPGEKNV